MNLVRNKVIPEKIIKKVIGFIDPSELANLTSDLVKINSVWDPAAGTSEQEVADYIARWAGRQRFGIQIDEVASRRPNVIITWTSDLGGRTLMFEAHTDVVTPGDVSAWSYKPFGAEIVGQRMYGRGTNDTKGNLAAMLIAMTALKRSGVKLAGTIIGGVLCDEEDRMLGVRDFINRGHANWISGAIICEPQDGLICVTQKGALRAQFTITGRMSHGAMPLTGLNTAPALAKLINHLHDTELKAIKHHGQDRYLGWPSFTPTVIQAPVSNPPQLNVMPGKAQVLVDIRTIPSQSHPDIRRDLTTCAKEIENQTRKHYEKYDKLLNTERNCDLTISTEILTDRPCTLTDRNDPLVQSADWATRLISGKEPTYAGVPGATDGTFLWALKNIPIVTMGAGDRQVPHQVDEWVDLDQLVETAKIYALTALKYLWPADAK
jgi:succinyl-diaminopimelate desuccinylase